jgi:putative salt-induced outer membrane protein YdiY
MYRKWLAGVVLLIFAWSARADQLRMKNGDRLTGTIVTSDGKALVLKTDYAGDLKVNWDAVAAVDSGEPLHLELKSGQTVVGRVSTQDGELRIATENAGTVTAEAPDIVTIRNLEEQKKYETEMNRKLHPRFVDIWGGLLDTGLSLTRGNSQTLSYTLSGKAARVTDRQKISLYSTIIYTRDNTTPPARTTANAIRGGLRDDINFSKRAFVFGFTDFEYDEFQHLDLRNVLGGGFGYHVIKTKDTQFDLSGGASFNQEYYSSYTVANPTPPPDTTLVAALTRKTAEIVLGESLDKKLNDRMKLSEQFSIYPNMSNPGDYRFQFDTTATTKLNGWLGWQVTFSDRFTSTPPEQVKRNDLLLSTGIRLTFGKGIL